MCGLRPAFSGTLLNSGPKDVLIVAVAMGGQKNTGWAATYVYAIMSMSLAPAEPRNTCNLLQWLTYIYIYAYAIC